jgi:exonuclease SbcC
MKILRVKLTNLNSLRGSHEVDFERDPLAGAGLFAITGATGAGKSTLLDAITLALYGKAARYAATPSPENMMSRHSGECMAEVEFQVPAGTYRAEWQLHRARGKADGKVQAPKRYVYDSSGQPLTQNVRDTEELIEKLIGLDFPRFLRSALLAQGEFAQFLKARPDERAALLESLTGTSIYSALGTLAHTEAVRRENDLNAREAAIQHIQLLPDEQRQRLIREIPAAESGFKQAKQDLEQANALLNKAANLATALDQEKNALTRQQTLVAEHKVAEHDLQLLSRHRLTIPFQGDLAALKAATAAATTAGTLLNQAKLDHSRALLKTGRCLRGLRQLVGQKIEEANSDIKSSEEKIRKAFKRKEDAESWLKEHKSDTTLPEKLTELVSDLVGLKGARRELDKEWATLCRLAMKLDRAEAQNLPQSAEATTSAKAKAILIRLTGLTESKLSAAKSSRKRAVAELKLREDHLAKARLVASFEDHRAGLKPGQPCPLCGAMKHPFAEEAEPSFPFKDLERGVEEANKSCRQTEKQIGDLDQLLADLQEMAGGLQAAISESSRIVGRLSKDLKCLALAVPPAAKEDALKSSLQQRASDYRDRASEAEKAGQDRAAAEAERSRFQSSLKSLQAKRATLASEFLPEPPKQSDGRAEAEETVPRWRTLDDAERDWSQSKAELASKGATLTNRQNDKQQREAELARLLSNISARLVGSAFTGIDDLKAGQLDQARAGQIEFTEKSLGNRAAQGEATLRAARDSIRQWRVEKAPEGEALTELKGRQPALQSHHDQLIRDLTTWKNQLGLDDANRKTLATKQNELETIRQQLVVWQRLRGLIGSHDGRTFRRYAQGISLDVLVLYANRHLLRLSDRYRLRRRQDEELDLEIEDLHQAGAVRPMESLSGGESFLASLALALGLSDIAGRNVRIESLFIDEGFGSLDSDTLDVAISALETLRQDSKTVGVISHVDLLKERIATQIIVEKQSGGTSSLRLAS